jgi:hypothetical protein
LRVSKPLAARAALVVKDRTVFAAAARGFCGCIALAAFNADCLQVYERIRKILSGTIAFFN